MAKTGILGTINSKLGQILLGTCTEAVEDLSPRASDLMTLTDATFAGGDLRVFATDALTLTDVVSTTGPWPVNTIDTLTLSDVAPEPGGPFLKDTGDSLNLTETVVVVGGAQSISLTEPLGLTEAGDVVGGDRFAGRLEFLFWSDLAEVVGGDLYLPVSESLGLTETIDVIGGAQLGTVADALSLTETITVAGGARAIDAADTLNLTDVIGDFGDVRLDEITESLGLTETIADGGDIREEASDALTLSEAIQEFEDVADDLGLTDEAISDDIAVAEDTLVLTDVASTSVAICVDETDSLMLTDVFGMSADYNVVLAESLTVTIEEYVIGDPGYFEDVDIGLRELAEAGGNINVTIEDVLSWFEIPSGWVIPVAGATETATDSLGLTEDARASITAGASDSLGWVDSASSEISYPATDSLELGDTATINGDFNVSASDTFVFSESFSSILSDSTCEYDESQAGPYPADTGLSFRLVGIGSWAVRAPRFGNKDVFSPQRTTNESRGGTLLITSQPEWPNVEVLKMDFSVLKKQEGLDLQDFLSDNLGQVITLTDWEGRAWTGVVNDVNVPLTEIGTDNFAMGFEFEGTKV